MATNKVNYQPEDYSGQVLDKKLYVKNWPIKSNDNFVQSFYIRWSALESEERYLGDGFFPREANWIELLEQD